MSYSTDLRRSGIRGEGLHQLWIDRLDGADEWKVAKLDQVETAISCAYEFVAVLPNGKVIVKTPS